jgi:Tol biopolymer transport system component
VQFDSAYYAWDAGHYIESLEQLEHLLSGPNADGLLEQIALLTGELYQVMEIAQDGRAVRWSSDGRYAAYETGTGTEITTHILSVTDEGVQRVSEVRGSGLVFAPSGDRVAYIVVPETEELAAALQQLQSAAAAGDRASRMRMRRDLVRINAEHARIVVREMASGRERQIAPDLGLFSLMYGATDNTLYFVGSPKGDATRTDIYTLTDGGDTRPLTDGPGRKNDPRLVLGGEHLAYSVGSGTLGVVELATGATHTINAASPVYSADGTKIAYFGRDGDETTVNVVDLEAGVEPIELARSTDRMSQTVSRACAACPAHSGLALSPDGSRVVFQMMPRENWELYVASADGSGARQLTREVQHDLYPYFLSDRQLLSMMGEGRHRRSHLHDLETGERTRLFRNNTVRTVAPEYEWAPSPDGSRLLIVAERDGDTVSPERGVYLLDLTSTVTKAEVLDRVRRNLAIERDLHDRAYEMFQVMHEEVHAAVADVSTSRIYQYEKDLFGFGSKYITQPGNQLAIDYLVHTLRSFGYEPELQWFEPRGVRTANVIVTIPGTVSPELVYVVSSHFDSNLRSPGADDNSSGTVALIETARVLATRPMAATIQLAFFTGEEAGLLGSREYVRRAVEAEVQLVGALNNDMVGWAENNRLDNTIRYSNAGIRDVQHAAAILFSDLITYDAKYYKSTDAHAYYEAYGDIVGGIGSYPILASPHYHQVHDVLETVNHQLVAEVTKTTVASIMLLASSPARLTDLVVQPRDGSVDVRWTPAPESDVTHYVVAYAAPDDPHRTTITVNEPRTTMEGLEPGTVVAVKAVNAKRLMGWDWAMAEVER